MTAHRAKTLSILGGLAVLAVVGGVSLGRSAIAEINPAYYQADQPGPFYADLVPNASSGTSPPAADADYLQADYAYSAVPTCIHCSDPVVEYRLPPLPPLPRLDDAVDSPAADAADSVPQRGRGEPPPANRAWVERYTTYTVAAEPAEPTKPVKADSAKPAEPAPAEAADESGADTL